MYRVLLLSGICCCLAGGCNRQKMDSKYLTNITVVRDLNKPVPTSVKDTLENKNNRLLQKDSIFPEIRSPKKGPYYMIVASYTYAERSQAEKSTEKLKAGGYPALLLETGNRLRVSIDNFSTETEANRQRKKYCELMKREDIWIYKMPD